MVLVDANVLLDVLTDDPDWREWSEGKLRTYFPKLRLITPE